MKKPIIAIDIDDVVAQGTEYLIESVNTRHNLALTREEYHAVGGEFWGYYERVWQAHGVGDLVHYADVAEEMAADQSQVPLLPGAQFAVHELAKRFHVIFITARPPAWEQATRRWFKQHLDDEDVELYFAGNHYDSAAQSKGQLAVRLGAELLIDDNISNCQSALDEGVDTILFGEYGWHTSVPDGMMRCKDWPAVLEYMNEAGR